jgi:hypothetical protein
LLDILTASILLKAINPVEKRRKSEFVALSLSGVTDVAIPLESISVPNILFRTLTRPSTIVVAYIGLVFAIIVERADLAVVPDF